MPINIITNSAGNNRAGGPGKVFANTVKGLEKINVSFAVNQKPRQYRFNWVHDSLKGFMDVVAKGIPSVLGPNLFVFPADIPYGLPVMNQHIFLHPSEWCIGNWKELHFDRCPLRSWPAGIDTDLFKPTGDRKQGTALLYYKKRKSIDVEKVYNILEKHVNEVFLLKYGSYSEAEYQRALQAANFGVWVGTTESQGIALQEALATDLPLIVIENQNILDHDTPEIKDLPAYASKFIGTTVPYWDNRCGIIIHNLDQLESAIVQILEQTETFSPRKFVLENLSLEKCAQQLVSFFDELDTSGFPYPSPLKGNLRFGAVKNIHFVRKNLIKLKRKFL